MKVAQQYKDKKVLVFGLGLQGGGVGDALTLHQFGAHVRVTDQKSATELAASISKLPAGIELKLGGHDSEDLEWADLILKNPGVPDDHPLIMAAISRGLPVTSSIAELVRLARTKVIGITGTRGKSTTTELIYAVLNSVYPGQIVRGGNIPGTSGLALLRQADAAKYLVLELSSFQLHSFHPLKLSPHLAVITNIYPDHLNRYANMVDYIQDKEAITAYQTKDDFAVTGDNPGARQIAALSPGQQVLSSLSAVPSSWQLQIPGTHNRENVSLVVSVSNILHINLEQVKKVVENFHGLPFRLENRGVVRGVTYINDTTSTTPIATIKAIEACSGPLLLILGGPSKNLPIDDLISLLKSSPKVKKLLVLGSKSNHELLQKLQTACKEKIIAQVHSMQSAVEVASAQTSPGWTVLLSPGFFSFDLFQNEFDRGRQFNEEVAKLQHANR